MPTDSPVLRPNQDAGAAQTRVSSSTPPAGVQLVQVGYFLAGHQFLQATSPHHQTQVPAITPRIYKNRENAWSDRHRGRSWWPSALNRPHNDGMTVSLLASKSDPGADADSSGAPKGVTAAPLLSVSGLSVSYGRVRALDNVNLDVRSGELVALAGENGAGKTT